jgi:peptide-methionine (S)-S-oxide reductase
VRVIERLGQALRSLVLAHSRSMVTPAQALRGRDRPIIPSEPHLILGTSLIPPFPDGLTQAVFAMGCFWGAERSFWPLPGVFTTAVGYTGGFTPNPTYREVCTGQTGHAEAVLVVFDPSRTSFESLTAAFFENHDPTQVMRQGNDVGTQYRSGIYTFSDEQAVVAEAMKSAYTAKLRGAGYRGVATEIVPAGAFYYAEAYHQQYLAQHTNGYCGLGGTGVTCPKGVNDRR